MNKKFKKVISFVALAAMMTTTAAFAENVEETVGLQNGINITDTTPLDTFDATDVSNSTSYTGDAITPDVELYDGSTRLVKGVDYDLSYENNINVGTATITVTFKGNYTGTRVVYFNIVARELSNSDVIFSTIDNQTYTGSPIEPKPDISIGDVTLEEGVDYDLSYTNNVNVGTATVNVTFKGNYSGTASTSFEITSKELTDADVTIGDIPSQGYTGNPIEPKPEIKYGEKTLEEGVDYDITYENNTNAGTATVTITFKGNYTGSVSDQFTIDVKVVNPDDVIFSDIENKTYTGQEIKPEPTVTVDGVVLEKDRDYTLSYANNVNVGTATVNVTFAGNYSGNASTSFTIVPMVVTEDNIKISVISDQTYTGKEITPEPTVTLSE